MSPGCAEQRCRTDRLGEADRQYRRVLSRFAHRLVGDSGRADDIAQEALVRLWQHPQVLGESAGTLRSWLFTVTRNLAYDELRCGRRHHEFVVGTDSLPDRGIADPCASLAVTVVVQRALATLSRDHRTIVLYAYYAGASTKFIAGELAIPPGTVKSRLHYAMRALRTACAAQGVTIDA
ncbi:sigma-70 family RNA polymerase sigma factor [Nocardia sp. NPDC060256]|uniref:sigma-70 family RNA polymerase sigma factor n=1 Tax=unclassified Nocardia TaxID=2637762 RepID=UPI00365C48EA